jgi:hypothetical protein
LLAADADADAALIESLAADATMDSPAVADVAIELLAVATMTLDASDPSFSVVM